MILCELDSRVPLDKRGKFFTVKLKGTKNELIAELARLVNNMIDMHIINRIDLIGLHSAAMDKIEEVANDYNR